MGTFNALQENFGYDAIVGGTHCKAVGFDNCFAPVYKRAYGLVGLVKFYESFDCWS